MWWMYVWLFFGVLPVHIVSLSRTVKWICCVYTYILPHGPASPSSHPSRSSQRRAELSLLSSRSPLASCFTHGGIIYVKPSLLVHPTIPFFSPMSTCLLSTSVLCLTAKENNNLDFRQYFHLNIYICLFHEPVNAPSKTIWKQLLIYLIFLLNLFQVLREKGRT